MRNLGFFMQIAGFCTLLQMIQKALYCDSTNTRNTMEHPIKSYVEFSTLGQHQNFNDLTAAMKTIRQKKLGSPCIAGREPEQLIFHVHFPGTKNLYELLNQLGYAYEKKAFVNLYFDTKNYDLIRNGLWYQKRFEYAYATHGQVKPLPIQSLKRIVPEGDGISITCSEVLNPRDIIEEYEKALRPLVSIDVIRHSFKTEFGYLRIEEASFGPQEACILATAVVNDELLFEQFCLQHEKIRTALELAPAASKVVERIRKLRAQRPKELEPLWQAMLEGGAIMRSDWTSEVCQLNPDVMGYPLSDKDEFWLVKGDRRLDD